MGSMVGSGAWVDALLGLGPEELTAAGELVDLDDGKKGLYAYA